MLSSNKAKKFSKELSDYITTNGRHFINRAAALFCRVNKYKLLSAREGRSIVAGPKIMD